MITNEGCACGFPPTRVSFAVRPSRFSWQMAWVMLTCLHVLYAWVPNILSNWKCKPLQLDFTNFFLLSLSVILCTEKEKRVKSGSDGEGAGNSQSDTLASPGSLEGGGESCRPSSHLPFSLSKCSLNGSLSIIAPVKSWLTLRQSVLSWRSFLTSIITVRWFVCDDFNLKAAFLLTASVHLSERHFHIENNSWMHIYSPVGLKGMKSPDMFCDPFVLSDVSRRWCILNMLLPSSDPDNLKALLAPRIVHSQKYKRWGASFFQQHKGCALYRHTASPPHYVCLFSLALKFLFSAVWDKVVHLQANLWKHHWGLSLAKPGSFQPEKDLNRYALKLYMGLWKFSIMLLTWV